MCSSDLCPLCVLCILRKIPFELPAYCRVSTSNPNIEWKATLDQAEKVGMGTRQYVLKKV